MGSRHAHCRSRQFYQDTSPTIPNERVLMKARAGVEEDGGKLVLRPKGSNVNNQFFEWKFLLIFVRGPRKIFQKCQF
jgi:hypothetical protein